MGGMSERRFVGYSILIYVVVTIASLCLLYCFSITLKTKALVWFLAVTGSWNIAFTIITAQYRRRIMLIGNTIIPIQLVCLLMGFIFFTIGTLLFGIMVFVLYKVYYCIVLHFNSHLVQKIGYEEWKRRIRRKVFIGAYNIILIFVTIGILLSGAIFYHNYYKPETTPATVNMTRGADDEKYFRENSETIHHLKSEYYEELNEADKIELAQFFVNYETGHLKLPKPVKVEAKKLVEKNEYSYYDESKRTIVINSWILKKSDARFLLQCICHEICHAEQYDICKAYKHIPEEYRGIGRFRVAGKYEYELNHYVTGARNYDAYAQQLVEKSARKYAKREVERLMKIIGQIE